MTARFSEEQLRQVAQTARRILWQARDVARQRGQIESSDLESLDEDDFLTYVGAMKGNLRYADLAGTALPAAARRIATQADPPLGLAWYLDLYRLFEQVRQEQHLLELGVVGAAWGTAGALAAAV